MRKGRSRWEKGEWGGPPPPFVQVVAAAASLSGGNCLLQGRCEAVILAPLLMVLLFWNILSAIFKLCCFSSDSLQVAVSFCVVSNQNRNGTELQFSICMLTRWCCWYRVSLIGRDLVKVMCFNYSKFYCVMSNHLLCHVQHLPFFVSVFQIIGLSAFSVHVCLARDKRW